MKNANISSFPIIRIPAFVASIIPLGARQSHHGTDHEGQIDNTQNCFYLLPMYPVLLLLDFIEEAQEQEGEGEHEFEVVGREAHDEANSDGVVAHHEHILAFPFLWMRFKVL